MLGRGCPKRQTATANMKHSTPRTHVPPATAQLRLLAFPRARERDTRAFAPDRRPGCGGQYVASHIPMCMLQLYAPLRAKRSMVLHHTMSKNEADIQHQGVQDP